MMRSGPDPSAAVSPSRHARYAELLQDLEDEIAELDRLLVGLTPSQWRLDTQSRGWTIAHQVGHLAITERLMHLAITDEPAFRTAARVTRTRPEISDAELAADDLPTSELAGWRGSRGVLLQDFCAAVPEQRMPWMGPPMSMSTAVTSRIMEVWAHGEDVYGAVGRSRPATRRLRHIAHLAVAARDYSFLNRGLATPEEPFRVEIRGPEGAIWTWGPESAAQRVEGEAYDFALLATRRIHRSDAQVTASGHDAVRWLRTIQAYAGPPGPRRRPRDQS